jgi:hypothetical protein
MYHYATTVCDIVGVREDLIYLWRDYIPQQAIKHPFLMHGILALAALHLAYLQPSSSARQLQTCDKHQAIALEQFRTILSSPVDPQLADARFALAAILAVSSMARSCAGTDATALDVNTIAELFVLTRGVRDMIQLSAEHIRTGPLAALLHVRRCPELPETSLPPSVSAQFETVQHMLVAYGLDSNALHHCQAALLELRGIYQNAAHILRNGNVELGDLSRWQVLVSMEYITLVQAHNPPALVILAHYAAAMTAVHTAWYTHVWAERALRGIGHALDRSMQHWIHWPTEQVKDRLSVLRAESIEREGIVCHLDS